MTELIIKIFVAFIGFILLAYIIGGCLYFGTKGRLGKKYYHDIMGYHLPSEEYFNGCSFVSKCKFCGKVILQDWQGNWFEGKSE